MGASVGVGGLIIGISMLVVFSMAYQAISLQVDSGLDRIDDAADEPSPTFTIDDAIIYTGAIVDVTINDGGSGYSSGGTIEASTGTGGFSATYTVNGNGNITSVVITSHGNYSSLPTLVVERWWNTDSDGESHSYPRQCSVCKHDEYGLNDHRPREYVVVP